MLGVFLTVGCSVSWAEPKSSELLRFTFTEYHMGVDARLVVYASDQKTAEDACAEAFTKIAELDTIMSDYRPSSELMKLCDKAGGPPVPVSPHLFKVLKMAQEVSLRSGGVFDVTVGPVVKLWRKARKTGVLPNPKDIEAARKLVGWRKMSLDEKSQSVRLALPGMRLDLGAIAKGYADDVAQQALKKYGITRALVEMGGDIVVSGSPPGTDGWAVEVPNASTGKKPIELHIANRAISSSGDTEQFVVIGNKQYSHVINPKTGYALTSRVQVTILGPTGLIADPVSTALTLLSPSARTKLLKAYPGTVQFVRVLKPGEE